MEAESGGNGVYEKIDLGKTASTDIILSILPVLDDFERAINAFEISAESTDALKHGIILIFGKFINILSQQGLQSHYQVYSGVLF